MKQQYTKQTKSLHGLRKTIEAGKAQAKSNNNFAESCQNQLRVTGALLASVAPRQPPHAQIGRSWSELDPIGRSLSQLA